VSTPRPPEKEFALRLRPLHGFGWSTAPEQRLKLALKRLLRDYGLRCVQCAPQPPAKPESSNETKAP
jgi:hypothetical protein